MTSLTAKQPGSTVGPRPLAVGRSRRSASPSNIKTSNNHDLHDHGVPHFRSHGVAHLVFAAREGDREAWNEIVLRFTNLLWKVARAHRLNEHDSADVVQSTWLRLLENLTRIDEPNALPGWLATTASREALDVLRRHKRDIPIDAPDIRVADEEQPEVDAELLTAERDAHLWRCLRQLPPREQHLLQALVARDKPSYITTAVALGMPVGSIGPTRMRALSRLRVLLDESEPICRETPSTVRHAPKNRPDAATGGAAAD